MIEHVLVLLDQLLSSEVAVLIKEVDFENLLAVGGVGVGEEVGDKEGEYVAEGSVADIGGEDVVVEGVEELGEERGTRRREMLPAYPQ